MSDYKTQKLTHTLSLIGCAGLLGLMPSAFNSGIQQQSPELQLNLLARFAEVAQIESTFEQYAYPVTEGKLSKRIEGVLIDVDIKGITLKELARKLSSFDHHVITADDSTLKITLAVKAMRTNEIIDLITELFPVDAKRDGANIHLTENKRIGKDVSEAF
ncbi:MAG: hypothetical protein HWE20_10780 [Gammaproteobacteria bacterium]|nr:hypothetical protein [Gammaproteobacteria bacterium]